MEVPMKLVIGGCAQGKLQYALQKYQLKEKQVWDAILPTQKDIRNDLSKETIVIYHFHEWIRRRLSEGGCPEEEVEAFLDRCTDCVIICDEIGNGIVPIAAFEREYRERTGRILIQLAQKAEEVERVICGIGQKIK